MQWKTFCKRMRAMESEEELDLAAEMISAEMLKRCGARTRQGRPCRRRKLPNGKCKITAGFQPVLEPQPAVPGRFRI